MEHVDTFVGLDSVVSLVPYQELDQLNITMKTGKMQRIEALLRL